MRKIEDRGRSDVERSDRNSQHKFYCKSDKTVKGIYL